MTCLFVLTQLTNVTDRHRMTAKAALDALASGGKNRRILITYVRTATTMGDGRSVVWRSMTAVGLVDADDTTTHNLRRSCTSSPSNSTLVPVTLGFLIARHAYASGAYTAS